MLLMSKNNTCQNKKWSIAVGNQVRGHACQQKGTPDRGNQDIRLQLGLCVPVEGNNRPLKRGRSSYRLCIPTNENTETAEETVTATNRRECNHLQLSRGHKRDCHCCNFEPPIDPSQDEDILFLFLFFMFTKLLNLLESFLGLQLQLYVQNNLMKTITCSVHIQMVHLATSIIYQKHACIGSFLLQFMYMLCSLNPVHHQVCASCFQYMSKNLYSSYSC